jgi:hypothetical protein
MLSFYLICFVFHKYILYGVLEILKNNPKVKFVPVLDYLTIKHHAMEIYRGVEV